MDSPSQQMLPASEIGVWQLRRIGPPSTVQNSASLIRLQEDGEVTVGRGPAADYFLDSAITLRLISRVHAVIRGEKAVDGRPQFTITNNGLNGTYINDVKMGYNPDNKQVLCEGDKITFGHPGCASIKPGECAPQNDSEFQFIFECIPASRVTPGDMYHHLGRTAPQNRSLRNGQHHKQRPVICAGSAGPRLTDSPHSNASASEKENDIAAIIKNKQPSIGDHVRSPAKPRHCVHENIHFGAKQSRVVECQRRVASDFSVQRRLGNGYSRDEACSPHLGHVQSSESVKSVNVGSGVNSVNVEESVNRAHMGSSVNRAHVEASVNSSHVGANVNNSNVESSANSVHVESSVNGANVGSSVNRAHVEASLNSFNVKTRLNGSLVETKVNRSDVETSLNSAFVESSINRSNMETYLNSAQVTVSVNSSHVERNFSDKAIMTNSSEVPPCKNDGFSLENISLPAVGVQNEPIHLSQGYRNTEGLASSGKLLNRVSEDSRNGIEVHSTTIVLQDNVEDSEDDISDVYSGYSDAQDSSDVEFVSESGPIYPAGLLVKEEVEECETACIENSASVINSKIEDSDKVNTENSKVSAAEVLDEYSDKLVVESACSDKLDESACSDKLDESACRDKLDESACSDKENIDNRLSCEVIPADECTGDVDIEIENVEVEIKGYDDSECESEVFSPENEDSSVITDSDSNMPSLVPLNERAQSDSSHSPDSEEGMPDLELMNSVAGSTGSDQRPSLDKRNGVVLDNREGTHKGLAMSEERIDKLSQKKSASKEFKLNNRLTMNSPQLSDESESSCSHKKQFPEIEIIGRDISNYEDRNKSDSEIPRKSKSVSEEKIVPQAFLHKSRPIDVRNSKHGLFKSHKTNYHNDQTQKSQVIKSNKTSGSVHNHNSGFPTLKYAKSSTTVSDNGITDPLDLKGGQEQLPSRAHASISSPIKSADVQDSKGSQSPFTKLSASALSYSTSPLHKSTTTAVSQNYSTSPSHKSTTALSQNLTSPRNSSPISNVTTIILSSGKEHRKLSSRSHKDSSDKLRTSKSSKRHRDHLRELSPQPSLASSPRLTSNTDSSEISHSRSSTDSSPSSRPSSKSSSESSESRHRQPSSSSSSSSPPPSAKFFKDTVPNLYSSSDEEGMPEEKKTEIVKKIYSSARGRQEEDSARGEISRRSALFKVHKKSDMNDMSRTIAALSPSSKSSSSKSSSLPEADVKKQFKGEEKKPLSSPQSPADQQNVEVTSESTMKETQENKPTKKAENQPLASVKLPVTAAATVKPTSVLSLATVKSIPSAVKPTLARASVKPTLATATAKHTPTQASVKPTPSHSAVKPTLAPATAKYTPTIASVKPTPVETVKPISATPASVKSISITPIASVKSTTATTTASVKPISVSTPTSVKPSTATIASVKPTLTTVATVTAPTTTSVKPVSTATLSVKPISAAATATVKPTPAPTVATVKPISFPPSATVSTTPVQLPAYVKPRTATSKQPSSSSLSLTSLPWLTEVNRSNDRRQKSKKMPAKRTGSSVKQGSSAVPGTRKQPERNASVPQTRPSAVPSRTLRASTKSAGKSLSPVQTRGSRSAQGDTGGLKTRAQLTSSLKSSLPKDGTGSLLGSRDSMPTTRRDGMKRAYGKEEIQAATNSKSMRTAGDPSQRNKEMTSSEDSTSARQKIKQRAGSEDREKADESLDRQASQRKKRKLMHSDLELSDSSLPKEKPRKMAGSKKGKPSRAKKKRKKIMSDTSSDDDDGDNKHDDDDDDFDVDDMMGEDDDDSSQDESWELPDGVQYYDNLCNAAKCLNPEGKQVDWVMCDNCEQWYHVVCVDCPPDILQREDMKFDCGFCPQT